MRFALLALLPLSALAADLDQDGLDDVLEQQLLDQYVPRFRISASDCDGQPAELKPGKAIGFTARNGTIYGQAFPAPDGRIELHYYHLWSRDCGLAGHKLDAEHVSALVDPERGALYWYAAAHEDTVCDWGEAARAASIGAIDRGPVVWISNGKHASYLKRESCGRGCGGDRCDDTVPMTPHRLINLGEPGYPLNGAEWIASPQWNLAGKMRSDFDSGLVARLDAEEGVFGVASRATPWPVMLAGSKTADAVGTGNSHTGRALKRAHQSTSRWLRDRFKRQPALVPTR